MKVTAFLFIVCIISASYANPNVRKENNEAKTESHGNGYCNNIIVISRDSFNYKT